MEGRTPSRPPQEAPTPAFVNLRRGKQSVAFHGSGKGTRLRALDEQTLVPLNRAYFQYSSIPQFHYSSQRAYSLTMNWTGPRSPDS